MKIVIVMFVKKNLINMNIMIADAKRMKMQFFK